MTELELCQLSQSALLLKNRKMARLIKRQLWRAQKAEAAVRKLLLRCEEYEKALETANAYANHLEGKVSDHA